METRSQKRLRRAKRARNGAHSKLKKACRKRKADKALRLDDVLLPVETLMFLLRFLTRDELERSQLVHRKFAGAVNGIFSAGDVPTRKIERIAVAKSKLDSPTGLASVLCMDARRSPTDRGVFCRLNWLPGVEWLARVVRFSEVEVVHIYGSDEVTLWAVASEIWHGLLNALLDVPVDRLYLKGISFCPLKASDVDRLTTLNVRTELCISSSHLLSRHITDAFLSNLSKMSLSKMKIYKCIPVDKVTFKASDDGALALCFSSGQPGRVPHTVLLPALSLTGEFYAKFLKKCQEAPEDRHPVYCHISPIPVEAERQLMALNPARRLDKGGNTYFWFPQAGWAFAMYRSGLKRMMLYNRD